MPHKLLLAEFDGRFSAATQTWNDGFLGLNWSTKERLAYAGDFNADGRQDLFFQAKTFPIVLPLAGFIVVPVPYGPAGMILHAGPAGHFSTINHQWGNGYLGISWDVDHYKPIIGQFDGGYGSDLFMQASNGGTAPIFVYSGITGGFESSYTLQMSGETMGYWGAGNAELSAGDLNGDGRADLVLAAQDGINSIAYTYHDGTIGVVIPPFLVGARSRA